MRRSLKALLIAALAGVIACGVMACGAPAEETSDVNDTDPTVAMQPSPGHEGPVESEVTQLNEVVADHILPMTAGPWPDSIDVTDKEIIFKKTGKVVSYDNVVYCRSTGEGEGSRFEYDVPVCLPSGKGLALFEAAYGYECWGASVKFYDPDGRLLSTFEGFGAWPYFTPDGERFINYIMGDADYEDWDGVQLCGIDGTIYFDIQVEQAQALITKTTGENFSQGAFYYGPQMDIWVTWDQTWNYFAFAFAGWNESPGSSGIYLIIYSAQGDLVQLLPITEDENASSTINQAIDAEFANLGTTRGGQHPD